MTQHEEQRAIELREGYIADITARLQGRLSAGQTFEQVTEIREHLDAMSRAFQELGEPKPSAMRMAIQKFGGASQIGESIVKASSAQVRRSPVLPGLAAMAIFNAALAFLWVMICRQAVYARVLAPAGYAGTSAVLNFLILASLAGMLCWYFPKVTPAKAAVVGFAVLNVNLPSHLYILTHSVGLRTAILELPWYHYLGFCSLCALSAYLAPRFRRGGRPAPAGQ